MEISFRTRKSSDEQLRTNRTVAQGRGDSFSAILQKQERATLEWRQQYLQAIDEQAAKLVKSRNFEDVQRYKGLIRTFLETVVRDGYALEEQRFRGPRGKQRIFQILREVDEALLRLTESVLDKEAERLQILQLLDEIRGLILNLYS